MDAGPHSVQNDLILKLSDDKKYVQVQFTASIKRKPIDLGWFLQKIKEFGLDQANLNQDTIGQCVKKYNKGTDSSIITIGNCIDGELKIDVQNDDMEAYLTVSPAKGGVVVNKEMVMAELKTRDICFGLLEEQINKAVEKAASQKTLIAKGQAPKHGTDGYFENLIPDIQDRRPRIDKEGIAHYNDIETFITVKRGDPLVRRHQSTSGDAGRNIFGETIPANSGENIIFAPDLSGTSTSPDDPNLLLASISGQPVIIENGAMVEPTITVDNVDRNTGNIEFDGSVLVNGNVTTGMKINISGDIHIHGMVEEASSIEAGGNIRVVNGIVGRGSVFNEDGEPGKGIIRLNSAGKITAKFIENTLAIAAKDILVEELVAHCNLTAGTSVCVGKQGAKRGHIMGGITQAGLLVQAEVLGSQASVHTSVKVGVNYEVSTQLHEINQILETKYKQRETVETTYAIALRTKNNKKAGFIRNLKATLRTIDTEILGISKSKEMLQQEIEKLKSSKIIAKRSVFNAVDLQVYTAKDKISEQKPGGFFRFENNQICYKPL